MNTLNFNEIIEKYPKEKRYTLAILQDIQRNFKYIPKDAFTALSLYLNIPIIKLYSMATFYKALSLTPKGKNIITVCDGTACHVRSSSVLIDELQKYLQIKLGETTKDGIFTLQTVNCLGSCAIAPVMVINDKYYGKVTPSAIKKILKQYGGEEDE